MVKRIVVGLVLLSFLMIPGIARADFFDSSEDWYMDSSWWAQVEDEKPSGVTLALVDLNDRLEWNVSGTWPGNPDEEAFSVYGSGWQFDLEHDFDFTVDYRYDHEGATEAGVITGLYYFPGGSFDPYTAEIGAENWWDGAANSNIYCAESDFPTSETESDWARSYNDGRFSASYISATDILTLEAFDWNGAAFVSTGSAAYAGIKVTDGVPYLGAIVGGWSEGANLASGNAYLKDFKVNGGTMTPEPVSSVLFLVGGASLVAARLRKRRI